MTDSKTYSLAIHGGAGTLLREEFTDEKKMQYETALNAALAKGQALLADGGSALDAVCASVSELEDCPLFNAGKGAVFNHLGKHELDASVMRGDTLEAGAIAAVSGIARPVELARRVMEASPHVLLCAQGAVDFALSQGFKLVDETYFHTTLRHQQWQQARAEGKIQLDHQADRKYGTVGAVARDHNGNLAAATSTGGMTNKQWMRIGDTPLIGAGTYAKNSSCAVSCTGHGEFFIRYQVAHDVSCLMEYGGLSLEQACQKVIHEKLKPVGGEGGLIAVDSAGKICLCFNSAGMYRGWVSEREPAMVAIF